jgi:hypothetical protein
MKRKVYDTSLTDSIR